MGQTNETTAVGAAGKTSTDQATENSNSPSDSPHENQGQGFVIPDAFKSEKVFEGVKSLDDVFKLALEGQRMIGRGIFLPDDKDPENVREEKLSKVFAKLGRPEKADQYSTKTETLLPEGYEWDKELIKEAQQTAHKHGFSDKQFTAMLDFWAKFLHKNSVDPAVQAREAQKVLMDKWGENGYELKMNEAYAAARLVGGKEFVEWLESPKPVGYRPGNDPLLAEFLAKLGRDLREEGVVDDSIVQGVKSPQDYEKEAKEIIADPKDPYNNPRDPRHRERVAHVTKLFELSTF